MRQGGEEIAAGSHWAEWGASLCLGAIVAALALRFHIGGAEPHPGPVVGELTFSGAGKGKDFLLVWSLILGSLAAFAAIAFCRRIALEEEGARSGFHEYLAFSLLPAVVWCASQVLGKPFAVPPYFGDLSLLYFSGALVLLLLAATCAWRMGPLGAEDYRHSVAAAIAVPVLAVVSLLSVATAAARLFLVPELMTGRYLGAGAAAIFLAAFFAAFLLLSGRAPVRFPERALSRLLVLAQLGLPLAFFALVLPSAAQGLPWERGAPLTTVFLIVLGLAALAGYIALLRIWRRGTVTLPSLCVAAIAVLALFGDGRPTPYGMDNPLDYYHHGEWLIPWQQWAEFGRLPYLDYSPSHGLVDYLSGMANDLLLDGTLAGFPQARQLVRGASVLAAAVALCRFAGPVPAVLALILFPVTGRYPIFIGVFCVLVLLTARALQTRPVRWLWCYLLAGTVLVLLAPGPGAMLVISLAPLAVFHLWRSAGTNARGLVASGVAVILLCAALLFLGPGEIVLAQIRFMLENRPLYGAVHGLDWANSLARDWPVNGAFWELARNLWLPAALSLLVVAVMRLWRKRSELLRALTEDRFALLAGTAGLFMLLVVPHTMGRIDAGGPSRPGALSVFALALLCLPLAWTISGRGRAGLVLALAAVLGLLAPSFSQQPSIAGLFETPGTTRSLQPGERPVDGAEIGLPSLGRGIVPETLIARMTPLKTALDGWLGPQDTYLDLTNANAQYFYTERAVPIESGAFLTLPAEGMQGRSVDRLRAAPPPVLLLGTLPSGAGAFTLPLRAPVLADWVFEQIRLGAYDVVLREPFVFAVRQERLQNPAAPRGDQKALLARLFAPPFLAKLPSVWGASANDSWFASLSEIPVRSDSKGAEEIAPGRYRVSGQSARFHIEPDTDSDFLLFELACGSVRHAGRAKVIADDGAELEFDLADGLHLVPLDADPMVRYAGQVKELSLSLKLGPNCAGASLSHFRTATRAKVGP